MLPSKTPGGQNSTCLKSYRHLEFGKTDAFAILTIFYQLPTHFVVMLRLCIKTQLLHRNAWWPESKMVAAAILDL